MMELYQTEWCPASRRIRQRLTELGVDYVNRQVPVEKADRTALLAATGSDAVPTLVLGNGTVLVDEDAIRSWLDEHVDEPVGAVAQRAKADRAWRRVLQEAAAELRESDLAHATPPRFVAMSGVDARSATTRPAAAEVRPVQRGW
jgi:glutathione S-transferase